MSSDLAIRLKDAGEGNMKASNFIDITGQKFNRLTVYGRIPNRGDGVARWICLCDCGKPTIATGINLRNGNTKSCGCLQKEAATINAAIARKQAQTHGMSYSAEYRIWSGMKARCKYPRMQNYADYGGRGIVVCKEWDDSFQTFYHDMGPRPKGYSIERKDVNGNYEPSNCYWATSQVQANNTRATHFVEYQGERMSLAQALRKANLPVSSVTVRRRIQKGYSFEDAISIPNQFPDRIIVRRTA